MEEEYTPEQRRIIDAGIEEGMDDFKKGRFHGPFDTAKQARDYIEGMAMKQAAARRQRNRALK